MRLITTNLISGHVSNDTIDEFEKTILSDSLVRVAIHINPKRFSILFFIYRLCRKMGLSTIQKTNKRYTFNPLADKKHLFTVMMGLDIYKYRPYGLFTSHKRSIFLFDTWPCDHEKITQFVTTFKIDHVFVTASQSAVILGSMLGNNSVHWIPEGINPQAYKHYAFEDKNIDVLAIGRKYDCYHESIVGYLQDEKKIYLYEKIKGKIIFPSREEFIEGIARSKISICVPSNITHPERSGDIETMTIRYLQSMVSKCMVVGHAPKEMIELFGYNPVVEIDIENPVEQIDDLLKNYYDYIPLIEKNFLMVLNHHTWSNRWNQIVECFKNSSLSN